MTSPWIGVQSLPRARPGGRRFPVLETLLTGVAARQPGHALVPAPIARISRPPWCRIRSGSVRRGCCGVCGGWTGV